MKDALGHGSNSRGLGAQGMRLQKTYTSPSGKYVAKVYGNPEWGEHVAKFIENGQYNSRADYHTEDKADAHATAQYQLKRYDDQDAAKALASGPKSAPAPIHDSMSGPGYSADAVNKAIASSNRSGRRIGGKEARAIHALLKGRH